MAKDYLYSVAEVYAQAVFELAEEQKSLQEIADDLEGISQCVESDPDFAHFLACPSISESEKAKVLTNIFADKINDLTMDFLKVLADRERLETLVYIYKAYKAMLDKASGRVEGLLTTAVEISSDEIEKIRLAVGQSLGKELILKTTVDPGIIGGIKLNVGNLSIDGSIRKQLVEMATRLGEHQPGLSAVSEE